VNRSYLRLASVAGAVALGAIAATPAMAAPTLSRAGANALTITVAGQENGTGNVTATNDGSGEQKTGDTEAPISDSGAQDFLSAGVLAQEATARAANGSGASAACAGLAGDGGSVVNLGGSECLQPTNQVTGSFGSFDPDMIPTEPPADLPVPIPTEDPTGLAEQLEGALAGPLEALQAQFGEMGLVAGVKVIEGRCTATPGSAQGSARIVDGTIVIQGGGQTIPLLDLPVNPPPNTHLVTDFGKVVDTIIAALKTNLNNSLNGAGAELNTVLDAVQQQVVNQVAAQVEANLAPLEENVLDITLNKQVRPSAGAIRVNALDLQLLPVAREQLGSSLVSLQVGNVVCGPAGRQAAAAPAPPSTPRIPTSVPAGLESLSGAPAPDDNPAAEIALGALAVLVAGGAGLAGYRRARS